MKKETSVKDIPKIYEKAKKAFKTRRTFDYKFRAQQLYNLYKCLEENQEKLIEATAKDGKCESEGFMADIFSTIKEIDYAMSHLKQWMKDEKRSLDAKLTLTMDSAFIRSDPKGTVLIIGTWNYPVNSVVGPLIPTIAGGNCAVVKFNEISVHTSSLLSELLPKYLDSECFQFVSGAVPQTTELLKHRWDHIMFTGNSTVARIIAKAAAEHLTPCTLELGGKNPALIDGSMSMKTVASRIVGGKCFNTGQTCIAPDYILIKEEDAENFIEELRGAFERLYGDLEDLQDNPDYGRVVSDTHWKRLSDLLENTKGDIVIGGQRDKNTRFFSPTVVQNVDFADVLMEKEIFGPILPVLTIKSVDEAIDLINENEKPLAAYIFSDNYKNIENFKNHVLSGGMVINDTILHFTCDDLPFGGVGESGYGAYHGKYGFDTFTHKKSVLWRSSGLVAESLNWVRFPPYQNWKSKAVKALGTKPSNPNSSWF